MDGNKVSAGIEKVLKANGIVGDDMAYLHVPGLLEAIERDVTRCSRLIMELEQMTLEERMATLTAVITHMTAERAFFAGLQINAQRNTKVQ